MNKGIVLAVVLYRYFLPEWLIFIFAAKVICGWQSVKVLCGLLKSMSVYIPVLPWARIVVLIKKFMIFFFSGAWFIMNSVTCINIEHNKQQLRMNKAN
jgi:hypothetical protein